MKKIFNWTFGSIFRTFGRIIAYLSVGLLISTLFLDLKVNAEELVVPVNFVREEYANINYNESPGFMQSKSNALIAHRLIYSTTDEHIKEYQITFDTTNKNYSNITYIEIPFTFSKNLISSTIDDNEAYFCEEWTLDTETNKYSCTQKLQYYNSVLKEVDGSNISINNFYIQLLYNDDTWNTCSLNNSNNIICNNNGKVPKQLYFYINFKTIKPTNFLLAISRQFRLYTSSTQEQIDAINNVKDSINNVNDSINNANVDDSTNTASNFFNNFSTDTHGLTGIITAPLNAIQSLTSKTCSPLVLPLPFVDKDLTLPCMREIYVDNFGAFMNIYDIITLGIVSYWVMVRIFALVKDFKNPDHDEIEVMDL